MILTYKYRVKDNSAKNALRRHAVAVNQVWNWCNAFQKDVEARYTAGAPRRKWPSHFDLNNQCKGVGKEIGLHQQTVSGVCKQFATSRNQAKRSVRYRASQGSKRSLGWIPFEHQTRQVDGNSVWYLGKRYRFFGSKRRPLPDTARGGCFIEDAAGRWYVCFNVEAPSRQHGADVIGIDLGLKSLMTTSNGHKIDAPRHYRILEKKIGIASRARNWRRVRSLHAKIKNSRDDFLHKLSSNLVRKCAVIAVGDVSPSRLKTTLMAKSVFDAGWTSFRSMLSYKCQQATACFIEVDEAFTTQTCSECGSLPYGRPEGIAGLGIREWKCSDCGASHDRDTNAARNILATALSAERPVVESRSRKQLRVLVPDKHEADRHESIVLGADQ